MVTVGDIGPFSSTGIGDWSSLISTIEGIGAFSAGYVLIRRHNCHVKGCWRVGRQGIHGTSYVVCRKHHPGDKPTHDDVLAAAKDAHHRFERLGTLAKEAERALEGDRDTDLS